MDSYLIKVYNKDISVFEISSDDISVLKFKGEAKQIYDEDSFWAKFKNKIQYENEELCFVVNTNHEDFKIEKSIRIAKQQYLDDLNLQDVIFNYIEESFKTFYIPNIKDDITSKNEVTTSSKKIKDVSIQGNLNLQDYYKKETLKCKKR